MASIKITTVKLKPETKARLNKLKEYGHESYDELLNKVMEILNFCKSSPDKASKVLYRINAKRQQLKNSGEYTDKELEEKFSL